MCDVAVIRTDKWLETLNVSNIIEEIGGLLEPYFPETSMEAIHFELMCNGLFQVEEENLLKELVMKQRIWTLLDEEYTRLRKLWNGPDVPIITFPITEGSILKNGVTYEKVIVLFVATDLEYTELKALLAHEYHHFCRMHYLKKTPREMTLLDSVILEGMAECAVESLYGNEMLSPWTQRYHWDEIEHVWHNYFEQALYQTDVRKHRDYLFGNEKGLPPWIGYCAGYRIVAKFLENHQLNSIQLMNLPSQQILSGAKLS
jgi:uncharacterized protein YjaZ